MVVQNANLLFEVKAFNIKNDDMFMILGHELIELKNKIIFLIDFGKSLLLFNRFLTGIKATFKFLKYPEVSTCKHNMRFQKVNEIDIFLCKIDNSYLSAIFEQAEWPPNTLANSPIQKTGRIIR